MQSQVGWRARRLEIAIPGRGPLPVLVLVGTAGRGLPRRLYVPKGPACAPGDGEAWEAVRAALARLAVAESAAAIEVEPNAWAGEVDEVTRSLGAGWAAAATTRQPATTAVVDLTGGAQAALGRMRPKGRYNVRLSARRGVACAEIAEPGEASRVLGVLLDATARRQDTHLADELHVRRVLAAMPGARVLVASVEGEAVAGLLLARFGGEAIYLYGGSIERHRDRQPSAGLQAYAMEVAAAAGCTSYDLWGLPPDADPGHPWHGLRQFKLNLGAVERHTAGALVHAARPAAARLLAAADGMRRTGARVVHDARAAVDRRPSGRRRERRDAVGPGEDRDSS
ncbi:MAG TPA: peptidoglycan bridge formation glycyltransferase FemA/FemB family protein [Candidatus Dormibacteraeota bacterium]|nr:peptidoglycan bridge formation glycyltransferase FemA/FemB family protein [Candidatus Dormibacteraeota bacterium]